MRCNCWVQESQKFIFTPRAITGTFKSISDEDQEHFSKPSTQPSEGHSLDKMVILENGPYLHHADNWYLRFRHGEVLVPEYGEWKVALYHIRVV